MNSFPREPNAGDKISAQLVRDIVRAVRRNAPVAGANIRLRHTPNGTVIDGTPGGTASSSSYSGNGCWKIGSVYERDSSGKRKAFLNRYYAVGGKIMEYVADGASDIFIDSWVMQGTLPPPEEGEEQAEYTEDDKPFVALVVSMDPDDLGEPHIEGFKTFELLQEKCSDHLLFVKPLYKLTHEGSVAIDFRNMPLCSAAEDFESTITEDE